MKRSTFWDRCKSSLPCYYRQYLHGHDHVTLKTQNQKRYLDDLRDPDSLKEMVMGSYYPQAILCMRYDDPDFFGLVRVDLEPDPQLPKHRRKQLERFPPLFLKVRFEDNDIHSLRGVLSAQKTLVSTQYLHCLYSLGYRVTKVYCVYEYVPGRVLQPFVDKAVEARKRGDLPGGNPLDATTLKLLINSFHGSSIMNNDNHGEVSFFTSAVDICLVLDKPTFMSCRVHSSDLYEFQQVRQEISIQLGFFVLNYAKMHLVHFYHHILCTYLVPWTNDLISMDTDSFTFVLSRPSLRDCVQEYLKESWDMEVSPYWLVKAEGSNTMDVCGGGSCSTVVQNVHGQWNRLSLSTIYYQNGQGSHQLLCQKAGGLL